MTSSTNHPERQPPRKATLYCPACEHANRINGDWIITVHATGLDYECPECGETIESRPGGSGLTARNGGALRFGGAD